jgi:hypothetical protein
MTMIDGENEMDSRKELFRQTLTVALGVALCAAVMVGVFALLGYFDMTVVWGALAGSLIAVGNFFAMGMTTTLAAEKAANQDVKGGQALISLSYMVRMALMLVALIVCGKSGLFNVIALAIPLVFVRPVLTVAEFFQKKGDNEA